MQYKRLSTAITFGGGEAKVLGSSGSNISSIEATGSCIVEVGVSDSQNLSNATEKWIESVMRTLQRYEMYFYAEYKSIIYINRGIK